MKNSFPDSKHFAFGMLALIVAVSIIASLPGSAAALDPPQLEAKGALTVTGMVKVDGKPAATGDIFNSSSTATTAKGSSAVVSLGKLGRVEVLPSSNMKLSFSSASITGWLRSGGASILKAEGVAANFSTTEGEIIANSLAAAEFTIDRECDNTTVSVRSGEVELHAKGKVTKVAAGSQGSLGNPRAGCTRAPAS